MKMSLGFDYMVEKNLSYFPFCQALPVFLDSLITAWGAILISVTLILLFGEVRNLLRFLHLS